ncbi:MAG TPA: lipid-A-disaccharide synthase [Bacteroidota bacterium]|jgi:lipid-A-disaccharide synthase|nr:lipid-A-disaccharide synthase [Bacteroidota bacterium]
MRVMIIAGEASGDLHGAGVVRELKRRLPGCDIYGIGGDKMHAAGMKLIYHNRELAFMGFWEVLQHLPLIRSVEKTLEALLKVQKPDVLLLIDYPGFNLRFANAARRYGIRIVYYISPQVWAWNPGRVKRMKGLIDKMLVVFPFEVDIYRKEGIDVEFVGHPLLEVFSEPQPHAEFCKRWGFDEQKKILGLFPGSRRQEVERIFPAMIGAARILHRRENTQTAVGVSSMLDGEFMKSFLRDDFPVKLIQNATYDVMNNADLALVTSGTATLEAGYFQTPMIVVYKTSFPTYLVGRLLLRIKDIGLVNIVAGRRIVPELLQSRVTPQRLAAKASEMLAAEERQSEIAEALAIVREKLGTPGASARVVESILSMA